MALRERAGTARLVVLTLLIGLAGAAFAPAAPRQPDPPAPGGWLGFAVLVTLTVPALVLVVIAGLRYRPPRLARPALSGRAARVSPWLGALALLGFLVLAVLWPLVSLVVVAVLIGAAGFARRPRTELAAEPRAARPESRSSPAVATMSRNRRVFEPAEDPRAAIIQCYAAMEEVLSDIPEAMPDPADSPSEVLDRACACGVVRSPTGWRLVELFDEARFSPHPMTEPDRVAAEAALRAVLAELGGSR